MSETKEAKAAREAAEAQEEAEAAALAEAQAAPDAAAKHNSTVAGGRYKVDGQLVNANGEPVK